MSKFHVLHSHEASLVVEQGEDGSLVWRHCGARVDPDGIVPLADARGPASFSLDRDVPPMGVLPGGIGSFGPPALALRGRDGAALTIAHGPFEVMAGEGSLEFTSTDPASGACFRQEIAVLEDGAFRFVAEVRNNGSEPLVVDSLASVTLPLPAQSRQLVSWRGRHNAELVECVESMPQHRWERVTRRGISGHGGPPGVYVLGEDAGWHSGLTIAAQLVWSGDSSLAVERDDEGFWTFSARSSLAGGEIVLAPGGVYRTPAALVAISSRGRNGAMAQQHGAVRGLMNWPEAAMRPRPVHLNSWEACYFDHDHARIMQLAKVGAEIGIERFVLDDGWFKGRRDDTAGLGDWEVDRAIYPDGLAPLAQEVEQLGLEFGLWVEPEMINPDSDLYRAHPDWALAQHGTAGPTARNQLVLDMRKPEVRDHLFERLDAILREVPVGYLKWDHNRDHTPSGGTAQTLGTYDLLQRLRTAHPAVEIEGCAGGGGRSDAGMAQYVHRFWNSDTIDGVSRVSMQRGFLAFLPPEIMGSHVGASPAHATGRSQSMAFRCAMAAMGHLGVELDPAAVPEAERRELAEWIAFYKQWRDLLHGQQVVLGTGSDGLVWQAQGNADRKLLFCIRTDPPQDRRPQPLTLPFAAQQDRWNVSLLKIAETPEHQPPRASMFAQLPSEPAPLSGSWLAEAGLPMPAMKAESVAVFLLEASTLPTKNSKACQ